MRILSPVALIASVSILSIPSLSAATSVSLIWNGINTSGGGAVSSGNSVTLDPSTFATLTLDVQIDVDSSGLCCAFIDFVFDTDLQNELNLIGWEELSWSNASGSKWLRPLSVGIRASTESTGSQPGLIHEFDGTTLGYGPENTTLTFARMVFTTNPGNIQNDGNDIFSANEVIGCNAPGCFVTDDVIFGGAGVNVDAGPPIANIPEPGAALLFGLGIGALAVARRRSRN